MGRIGFIARAGQIIDASIVSAPIQRNRREENAAIKADQTPAGLNDAKRMQEGVDARWTRKQGKSFYGYNLHTNMDRRWALYVGTR